MTPRNHNQLKRLLVHLHVYYHEQVDYFVGKLGNISGVEWDLAVTYSTPHAETERKLREVNANARFIQVENYGYDVWPFIKVIQQTDLDRYDYVLKLHTKRSVPQKKFRNVTLTGYGWRDMLVDGVLANADYFNRLLSIFANEPATGMLSCYVTLDRCHRIYRGSSVMREMNRIGLDTDCNLMCHGTMFLARASVFKGLQQEKVNAELFCHEHSLSDVDDTNAHIYERIFSLLPSTVGMAHKGVYPSKSLVNKMKTYSLLSRALKWLFTIDKISESGEKYLIFMGLKFKL